MNHNQRFGKWGEEQAMYFLRSKGYVICETNYRSGKAEIDIIAQQDDFLIFVEVKTRKNNHFGAPEAGVSERKEVLYAEAAEVYLEEKDLDMEVRFDVLSICGYSNNFEINHIEDAF